MIFVVDELLVKIISNVAELCIFSTLLCCGWLRLTRARFHFRWFYPEFYQNPLHNSGLHEPNISLSASEHAALLFALISAQFVCSLYQFSFLYELEQSNAGYKTEN